jgi:protein PhnA
MQLPNCPKCNSEYAYEDNGMFICPECAHEWNDNEAAAESDELIVKDANGNLLADGDSVTVIKDLKVKEFFHAENRHESEEYPSGRRRS